MTSGLSVATLIVLVAIATAIAFQISVFVRNIARMRTFREIFSHPGSWGIDTIGETGATGLTGRGNTVFRAIAGSINEYLSGNTGSVIDFGILKDTVDRHTDAVEEDITTVIPFPLYFGLMGTMAGVIVGLVFLLLDPNFTTLLDPAKGASEAALGGIPGVGDLLSGVALAMVASIVGILLTTLSSFIYKKSKLEEERGKNEFLSFLQSRLLPVIPTDASSALTQLSRNLDAFNQTFADNSRGLGETLEKVNDAYRIQAHIVEAIQQMDVLKMATANVQVLRELQASSEELETLGRFLSNVNDYHRSIQEHHEAVLAFNQRIDEESGRLHVLEEIRDFFARHKAELSKETADADNALREAVTLLRDNTAANLLEFNKEFTAQAESHKALLEAQNEAFGKALEEQRAMLLESNRKLQEEFASKLGRLTDIEEKLASVADIPASIEKMIRRMEASNRELADTVYEALLSLPDKGTASAPLHSARPSRRGSGIPSWLIGIGIAAAIVIALAEVLDLIFSLSGPFA